MENKERDYKEERFEFAIYVNDNIICKRNFRIYNYIENSMNTLEFKETVDEIVHLIDEDLKSKSRVYTWYNYVPEYQDGTSEFELPLIEPWACTFKIVISDNKKPVLTRIWDGYGYPKSIREKVDLGNKYVKFTNRDGQNFSYDKETFFSNNKGRLTFEQEVLRGMIMDRPDVLLQITKKICEACSPSKDEIKEKGYFDPRDTPKYLSRYTTVGLYGNPGKDGSKEKARKYPYSLYLSNRKVENAWGKAVSEKTKAYFKNLY
jgi:hypothetical protein